MVDLVPIPAADLHDQVRGRMPNGELGEGSSSGLADPGVAELPAPHPGVLRFNPRASANAHTSMPDESPSPMISLQRRGEATTPRRPPGPSLGDDHAP